MTPQVELLDIAKADDQARYIELLKEGFGILDKAETNEMIIRVLVKAPEKKIETLKK